MPNKIKWTAHLDTKLFDTFHPINDGVIWDDELKGFGLRVYRSGKKAWYVQLSPHGRKSLSNMPVEKARKTVELYKAKILTGVNPFEELKVERAAIKAKSVTVALAFDKFSNAYLSPKSKSHRDMFRRTMLKYVIPVIGARYPRDVTTKDIVKLLGPHVAERPPTAQKIKVYISKFWNWMLLDADFIDHVDVSPVVPGMTPTTKARTDQLPLQDIRTLYECADGMPNPYSTAWLRLLILAGQRVTETSKLQRLHLQDGVWEMPRDDTKNGLPNKIPLTDRMLKVLDAVPRHNGEFVFSVTGGMSPINVDNLKNQADKASRLDKKWTFHGLRRGISSTMQDLDILPHIISSCMGHAIQGVEAHYQQSALIKQKRDAYLRYEEALFSADCG